MRLRALRSFHLAPAKRSIAAGEVFDVGDVYEALELCDGVNADFVDDRDRAQFRRREHGGRWLAVDVDRPKMAPDPAAIAASVADMRQAPMQRGFVKRWRGDRPRKFFGIQV
jgi:hypothetical protein